MNTDLFKFPNSILVFNADSDGDNVVFDVVSVGNLFVGYNKCFYRILSGLGVRLEIYDESQIFLCQFHYEYLYEAFADIMRFYMNQLEFEYDDNGDVIGKIYKYRTE